MLNDLQLNHVYSIRKFLQFTSALLAGSTKNYRAVLICAMHTPPSPRDKPV